jgi:hypothetical protein
MLSNEPSGAGCTSSPIILYARCGATRIGANREATTRALQGAVWLRDRYIYVTDMEALKRASG